MIPLLLSLGGAVASDNVTYDRLFPADGSQPAPAAAPSDFPSPWRLVGPMLLGAVGLGFAWRLKRRPTPIATNEQPIVIVGRQPLGDRSALLLVEVAEPSGDRRRLLVGTGTSAPTLVADLGTHLGVSAFERVLAERTAAADGP